MPTNRILRTLGIALTLSLLIGLIPMMPAMAAVGAITISPNQGSPGQAVTVTGTGFSPSSIPYILWQGSQISTTGTVNGTGYLTAYFTVPSSVPRGSYSVTVQTSTDTSNSVAFSVTPAVSLVSNVGSVGDQITVHGSGFTASDYVVILFDSVSLLTATATNLGDVSGTITIPPRPRGTYTVTLIGPATESATTPFTISSKLTVSPTTAAAGDTLTISGSGFGASQTITIYFDGVPTGITTTTDTLGSFSLNSYKFPNTYAGAHTIQAQDASISISTTITTKQSLSISPDTGPVNTKVTFAGTGFLANASITITLDNVAIPSLSIVSDAQGSISGTFDFPPMTAGSHQIKVTDGTATVTKTYLVIPSAKISSNSGVVGAKIIVTGTGFIGEQEISILFDNSLVKTFKTDSLGDFNTSFEAPSRPAGTYKIRVTDGDNFVDVNFTITTSASITQTTATNPAYVGQQITVSGVGFKAGANLTIDIDGKEVKTGVVGSDSNFSIQFTAPAIKGGVHTVTISDGTTTLPLPFYMDATAPPAPTLVSPDAGIRAKATPTLIWNPVADPSNVTYTLQISTDTGSSTLVLEKTGISTSEYTLTKDEKLKTLSKDNAYYWRVKAIDGAFNEGGYSNARSFVVGSAFPVWALWTLIGLAALIILLFVYWLGRRTAVARPPSTRLEG
jgi:hypothetical protein